MTTPHPHAAILRAIAEGKQIQDLGSDKTGTPCYINVVNEHALRVIASGGGEYLRIAPETITVNGVECPKPVERNASLPRIRIVIDNVDRADDCILHFSGYVDAHTVFDALCKPCKPFKSEGV